VELEADVLIINFNGDDVDCTVDNEVVVEDIVQLLFFVVDKMIGVELDLLTSLQADVVGKFEFIFNIDLFCNGTFVGRDIRTTIGARFSVDNMP